MKAIKIDRSGAIGLTDWDFTDPLGGNGDYDAISLGRDHSIYVDDEALFRDTLVVTSFPDCPNLPLPAVIVGRDGERDADATLSVEDVAAIMGAIRRVR